MTADRAGAHATSRRSPRPSPQPQTEGPAFPDLAAAYPPADLLPAHIVLPALALVCDLGIADLLATGPKRSDDLAIAIETDARSLYRLLRMVAGFGLLSERGENLFALTSLGERFRSGVPDSLRSGVQTAAHLMFEAMCSAALESLRTGLPALRRDGLSYFDYLVVNPDESELFNAGMDEMGERVATAVVDAYDFAGVDSIVDVGGGHGTQLSAILEAYPETRGVLLDLPNVIDEATTSIEQKGRTGRLERVGSDFFDAVPSGADVYLLRWVIHDWDRERALRILRNCRNAMTPSSRLLLIEAVVPAGDEPHLSKSLDFVMLVAFGGQERTENEYRDLLEEAGFRLQRVIPTASPLSVLEAFPA